MPKDKGLDVCDDYKCNRPIDILSDGSIKKSALNEAASKSVSYLPGRIFAHYPFVMTTGDQNENQQISINTMCQHLNHPMSN